MTRHVVDETGVSTIKEVLDEYYQCLFGLIHKYCLQSDFLSEKVRDDFPSYALPFKALVCLYQTDSTHKFISKDETLGLYKATLGFVQSLYAEAVSFNGGTADQNRDVLSDELEDSFSSASDFGLLIDWLESSDHNDENTCISLLFRNKAYFDSSNVLTNAQEKRYGSMMNAFRKLQNTLSFGGKEKITDDDLKERYNQGLMNQSAATTLNKASIPQTTTELFERNEASRDNDNHGEDIPLFSGKTQKELEQAYAQLIRQAKNEKQRRGSLSLTASSQAASNRKKLAENLLKIFDVLDQDSALFLSHFKKETIKVNVVFLASFVSNIEQIQLEKHTDFLFRISQLESALAKEIMFLELPQVFQDISDLVDSIKGMLDKYKSNSTNDVRSESSDDEDDELPPDSSASTARGSTSRETCLCDTQQSMSLGASFNAGQNTAKLFTSIPSFQITDDKAAFFEQHLKVLRDTHPASLITNTGVPATTRCHMFDRAGVRTQMLKLTRKVNEKRKPAFAFMLSHWKVLQGAVQCEIWNYLGSYEKQQVLDEFHRDLPVSLVQSMVSSQRSYHCALHHNGAHEAYQLPAKARA